MKKIMTTKKLIRNLKSRCKALKEKGITYKEVAEKGGLTEPWMRKFMRAKDPALVSSNIDALEYAVEFYENE